MKLWRGRKPLSEHRLDATEEVTMQQIDQIEALGRRVAALELAAHDHCLNCGVMTPCYGMTECGRAECGRRSA